MRFRGREVAFGLAVSALGAACSGSNDDSQSADVSPAGGLSGDEFSTGGRLGSGGVAQGGAGPSGSGGSVSGGTASGGSTDTEPAPFKGVADSPCAARQALGVSWYYNWTQSESEPCSDGSGGDFVPMIWGHGGDERDHDAIEATVASFVTQGKPWALGFNEPDNPNQSNVPVQEAVGLWPAFDNAAIHVASPATAANANPGQAWFTDFMTQLNADPSLRADALAIHWYGWNAGSCDANAGQLASYLDWVEGFAGDRPIWITEWGCLNKSAPDVATVVAFYQGALEVFAAHPRVERYAWYPWASNCGLSNEQGVLTALGEAYAAAPAYH